MRHKKVRAKVQEGIANFDFDEDDVDGYHITDRRGNVIRPIGYCQEHDPHETPEAAAECWMEFNLTEYYSEGGWQEVNQWRPCDVCGELGNFHYQPPPYSWLPSAWTCESHKGKEIIRDRYNKSPQRQSLGSY